MKTRFRTEPGLPQPKGATIKLDGVNFALFSRHAESVSLVIALQGERGDAGEQVIELKLDPRINKTGDIWHILVHDLPGYFKYGYRLDGPNDPRGKGHSYDSRLVLIDPYAKIISPTSWGEDRSFLGKKACSMIPEVFYDWEGDRPLNTPLKDSVIYELMCAALRFTPPPGYSVQGCFRGLSRKSPISRNSE